MYKSQGGGPGSYTEEREKEIFLARSVFLRCGLLLAQEIVRFLPCICDEHSQQCCQCYGKKYFHDTRIARNLESAFCRGLTTGKQICKHVFSFREVVIISTSRKLKEWPKTGVQSGSLRRPLRTPVFGLILPVSWSTDYWGEEVIDVPQTGLYYDGKDRVICNPEK